MPGEILLGRIILNSLLLACLPVLDVLLVLSTDSRFPINILSATSTYFEPKVQILPIFRPTDCI